MSALEVNPRAMDVTALYAGVSFRRRLADSWPEGAKGCSRVQTTGRLEHLL